MSKRSHRIRRQRWVVNAPTTSAAFTIRQHMRNELEEKLLAAFERAFDEVAGGPETIRVSRLDLDLKVASERELADELPELIYRQLRERLGSMLDGGKRDGQSSDDALPAGDAPRPETRTDDEDRFETLLHYLRTGLLPWSAAGAVTGDELRESCMRERERLVAILRSGDADVPFIFRLLQLLDEKEMPEFVKRLVEDAPPGAEADAAGIAELLAQPGAARHDWLLHGATLLAEALAALERRIHDLPGAGFDAGPGSGSGSDVASGASAGGTSNTEDVIGDIEAMQKELAGLLDELQGLIDGSRTLDAIESIVEDIAATPAVTPESIEALLGELGAASDRSMVLRIVAGLVGGGIRGASGSLDLYDGAQIILRLLAELQPADARVFVDALVESVAGAWKSDLAAIVHALLDAESPALPEPARRRIAATALAGSLRHEGGSARPDLASLVDRIIAPEERAPLNELLAPLPETARALLDRKGPASAAASGTPPEETRRDAPGDAPEAGPEAGPRAAQAGPASTPEYNRTDPAGSASRAYPMMVQNAGLVILHSFIVPVLTNTGIIEPGAAELSMAATSRAAALLHFLATGKEEAYEFELGLPKVLLGMEIDQPLLLSGGLIGPAEMEEAEGLLDAVIGHWSVLKNTSRDGLRGTFLERKGLLRLEDDGWRLYVEASSFDVLLGSLPWGINIVKLPWMPKPIHVEWERS